MANNAGLGAGGRVAINVNGRWYHPVADVKVEQTSIEPDAVVNQDGSVQRIVKPKSFKIDMTIRDRRGLNLEQLMTEAGFDVTLSEVDQHRRVLLTNAFATGPLSRNTQNGEISGLVIQSDQIKIVELA